MGALDQIQQMKEQGMSDEQIMGELQQQGVSPRAINDAMSQSQIKSAVADPDNVEEFQPSPMGNPEIAPPTPMTQESYAPQTQEMPQEAPYPQEGYDPQAYAPQEYAGGYEEDTGENYSETMIEIAEQVFSEKIKKTHKQIDELREFKALAETKIEYMENSLSRIEKVLDKLQIAILEKVGSYGQNLESIKKEMAMMQDSFGKVIKHKATHTTPSKNTSKKK